MNQEQIHHPNQLIKKYISPPNPIITKKIQQQKLVALKLESYHYSNPFNSPLTKRPLIQIDDDQVSEVEGDITLINHYSQKNCVYKKWDNYQCRTRNKRSYFASVFYSSVVRIPNQLPTFNGQGLRFNSKFQSGNLFAAYKTGQNMYDLVLQNDLNTASYTQWYYFSVSNTRKNTSYQFNIVNFYKGSSLYNFGMKPLVKSLKSQRGWRRSCTGVYYDINDILKEGSHKKYYKSLTFTYQFLYDDDQVSFAHCFPYDLTNLKHRLKALSESSKVKIKTIGSTVMKRSIPMIHISSQSNKDKQKGLNVNKKAIILMARQHPGQTPGSYILDQILHQIIKNNSQNQFLLWRFDFYIFPIINIDGVALGNYRGNAFGYDLNRCWEKQTLSRQPQVFYIKNQIKKIAKRQQIDLLIDFHGHSRKMGSFFYGNPFGKNNMIFPYIASKLTSNISFSDSTFSQGKSQKAQTARVVIGNLLKQTGSVYTYETTFYGSYKNGKRVHFTIEDYRELGKHILSGIHKTFIQIYKQQKSMKESLYFKDIRKQLKGLQDKLNGQQSSCSDFQDQALTIKQLKIKHQQQKKEKQILADGNSQSLNEIKQNKKTKNSIQIQVSEANILQQNYEDLVKTPYYNAQINVSLPKQRKLAYSLKHAPLKHFQNVSSQSYAEYQRKYLQQMANAQVHGSANRRKFLMDKLRVFGQTFVQAPRDPTQSKNNAKIVQASDNTFAFQPRFYANNSYSSQQKSFSPSKNHFRKKKMRNNSLMLKIQQKKLPIGQIVQVHRLQYKKIRRDSTQSNSNIRDRGRIPKFPAI